MAHKVVMRGEDGNEFFGCGRNDYFEKSSNPSPFISLKKFKVTKAVSYSGVGITVNLTLSIAIASLFALQTTAIFFTPAN